MRIILLSLLIILALSQTIVIVPAIVIKDAPSTPQNPPTPPSQLKYKSISLTQMDKVYVFLIQQINSFYSYVIEFKLTQVNERTSPDGLKKQVVFSYNKQSKTSAGIPIKNDTTIMALGTDNMSYFVLFDGQTINYANYSEYLKKAKNTTSDTGAAGGSSSGNSGSINGSSAGDIIVGGKTSGDIFKLKPDQIQIQNYLITKVQKLKRWTLISFKTQIVAGTNYIFTYYDVSTNKTEQYTVWNQPWNNNFLEIRFPNDTRINNQPVDASFKLDGGESSNKDTNNSTQVPLDLSSVIKPPIAGGIDTLDALQLNDQQTQIKNFIVKKVPKLATWQLTTLEGQVVQGMRYCYTFKDPQSSKSERYCAWSWDGSVLLTLPDGSIIKDSLTITIPLPGSQSDTLSVGTSAAAKNST